MLSNAHSQRAINIFYCYAHEDRKLQYELSKHLTDFKWEGLTTEWGYLDISPGQEREKEIANHLDNADIILLLITPDFMASYHCHEVEMKRAIAKHRAGTARVIPILLRPVTWENAPFRDLQPLPTDKKPIMSWGSKGARDKAFSEVSRGIKRVVNHFLRYQQESRPQQPVIKPSADQLGYTTSQISVDHKQSGQVLQQQPTSSSHFSQGTIGIPAFISSSPDMRELTESWLHLRWAILATAIATGIVLAIGLVFPVIIDKKLWLIPWVICLILGSVETNHFDQWYWFVGFIVFGPFTGLFYAVVDPVEKPHRLINLKQLIVMLLLLGYALLFMALIINGTYNTTLAAITAIIGALCVFSAWLVRILNNKNPGEMDFIAFFFPAGLSKLDSQLNELDKGDNE